MVVEWVLQHREHRVQLRPRRRADALGRRRVERHAGGAVAVVHHDLHERATSGVAHQDRRCVERTDHRLELVDDRRDRQIGDRGRVGVQRLHLDLESRIGRGDHLETLAPRSG